MPVRPFPGMHFYLWLFLGSLTAAFGADPYLWLAGAHQHKSLENMVTLRTAQGKNWHNISHNSSVVSH